MNGKSGKMKDSDFLNLESAQKFLNENIEFIFEKDVNVKLVEIKRSNTYNPEAFNLLYTTEINGEQKLIRISISLSLDKEHTFKLMDYLYENGFNQKPFFISKPLAYLKDENVLIYENVEGEILKSLLSENSEILRDKIIQSSQLLKKVHSTSLPSFPLFDTGMFFKNFNFESITKSFPILENKIEKIVALIKNKLILSENVVLCHGDFNPNNIIFNNESIFLMDFDLSCSFYKEIDLASFIAHLRLMFNKINRDKDFEILKEIFLQNYGEYNLENLNLFLILIDTRLLEIAINYDKSGYNKTFVYNCLIKDINNSRLINI